MEISSRCTTVDQKDYNFFKTVSSSWWDNPQMLLLQNVSELVVPYLCSKIREHYPEKSTVRVLEVGCGGGFLSERLARAGFDVVAIDINEDLLNIANAHLACHPTRLPLKYILEPVEEHGIKNAKYYDVVISNFVLEHVADHDFFIKCCTNCVKPGGLLFMSAIAKTYLSWMLNIFLAEMIMGLCPRGMHEYSKFISVEDTERMVKSYKFTIKDKRGMFYLSNKPVFCSTCKCAYIVMAARNTEY